MQLLELGNNNLSHTSSIWESFVNVLPELKLEDLRLHDNRLGNSGVEPLAKVLPKTSIHSLVLAHNHIRHEGAMMLAAKLPQSKLVYLDLSHNEIESQGAAALACTLEATQLEHLDLGHNGIGTEGAMKLADVLARTHVSYWEFGGNGFGTSGSLALAEKLRDKIGACVNAPESSGSRPCHYDGHDLAKMPDPESFCRGRGDACRFSQGVYRLDLSANSIGDVANVLIAMTGTTVKQLLLAGNSLDDSAATVLAEHLRSTSVDMLDMSDNNITRAGLKILIAALARRHPSSGDSAISSGLNVLDLRHNPVWGLDSELARELKKHREAGRTIQLSDDSSNPSEDQESGVGVAQDTSTSDNANEAPRGAELVGYRNTNCTPLYSTLSLPHSTPLYPALPCSTLYQKLGEWHVVVECCRVSTGGRVEAEKILGRYCFPHCTHPTSFPVSVGRVKRGRGKQWSALEVYSRLESDSVG